MDFDGVRDGARQGPRKKQHVGARGDESANLFPRGVADAVGTEFVGKAVEDAHKNSGWGYRPAKA
jgi:hypothetical protein